MTLFSNDDVAHLKTIPAAVAVAAYDACARATLLTRRMAQLVRLLDAGWVFELSKPAPRLSKRTGKPLHQRAPRLYLMRAPAAHETDGPVVTAKMVDRLIELGFAVRVSHAWAGKTWIYSRSTYEKSPMGRATSGSGSTGRTGPDTTSTPKSSPP